MTESWMIYATNEVEIHLDALNGPHFASSEGGSFYCETERWARDCAKFPFTKRITGSVLDSREHNCDGRAQIHMIIL